MRTVLHLLSTPPDRLTADLLALQQAPSVTSDFRVVVRDLSASAQPDYDSVLESIFEADSVSVW